jgi:type I restriction enzyme, S subunit
MMNASQTRDEIEAMCATTAGNIGLSAGRLKTIKIPLPPLAEQRRIVAKIDRLMAFCDRLEESIEAAKGKQADLLDVLMSHV